MTNADILLRPARDVFIEPPPDPPYGEEADDGDHVVPAPTPSIEELIERYVAFHPRRGHGCGQPKGTTGHRIRCIETGREYRNAQMASEAIGVTPHAIYNAMRRGRGLTGPDGARYTFVRAHIGVLVRCNETGIEYASIQLAADAIGRPRTNLANAIMEQRRVRGKDGEFYTFARVVRE